MADDLAGAVSAFRLIGLRPERLFPYPQHDSTKFGNST